MHMTNEDHSHCECGCGGHDHDHEHEHCHEHNHDHCHEHTHGEQPKDEDTAVLAYMLDHNRHHAQELSTIAQHLREAGKEEAAAQVEKGVEDFEKGNMRLSIALSLIQ
ncbi:MAG: cobalt transporter [Lachnospiraceae bacterium]|nr:cobalt transporter [Lachnospiraceae bacterium]